MYMYIYKYIYIYTRVASQGTKNCENLQNLTFI